MRPKISVEAKEFQAAAKALFETSSRTCVDFTNGQALKVAIESVRETDKANRAQIAAVLGATGQGVSFKQVSRGKNKGQMRTVRGKVEVREDSFAERILGKRFQLTGEWGVRGNTMAERVRNFIAARVRSAGFVAAGWIGARNVLWSQVKQKPAGLKSLAGATLKGKPKGTAVAARFSLKSKIVAIIENSAFDTDPKEPSKPGNAMPIAEKGLNAALKKAAEDMINELKRRLDPDFKKASAK